MAQVHRTRARQRLRAVARKLREAQQALSDLERAESDDLDTFGTFSVRDEDELEEVKAALDIARSDWPDGFEVLIVKDQSRQSTERKSAERMVSSNGTSNGRLQR